MTLGWIGNIFLIIGLWFVSPSSRWPFILTIIGEVIWGIYSYQLGHPDMVFICVVFTLLAARNYQKWSKENI